MMDNYARRVIVDAQPKGLGYNPTLLNAIYTPQFHNRTMATVAPTRQDYTLTVEAFAALHRQSAVFAEEYMSRFDPSHDFAHVQRVARLAQRLASAPAASPPAETQTQSQTPHQQLDSNIVALAALLHDVGDHKYVDPATDMSTPSPLSAGAVARPVEAFLLSAGAPTALARGVQTVVTHVSFSHESGNPDAVRRVLAIYPELGVVQDADRLDALGAVGLARCFAFGAAKMPQRGLGGCVDHIDDKLVRLEPLMKTAAGRTLARERTRRVVEFQRWWLDEVADAREAVDEIM